MVLKAGVVDKDVNHPAGNFLSNEVSGWCCSTLSSHEAFF